MARNDDARTVRPGGAYARYVLAVLFLVYVLNFVDRQILSILAKDVKRDLGLDDADIGFLFGTAFGVFYSLFGIPLGRLADNWHRVRLITVGLAIWSAMTAFSGLARAGMQLTMARIGVGVGEATASPCAYSLISDYFPRERRATALAVYSSGIFIGGGLSLFIGGAIVDSWNHAFPAGHWGLVGWQVAFMAVGVPGLLLAALVSTLREPVRGESDGLLMAPSAAPFRDFLAELVAIIPPLTLVGAARRGPRALIVNLIALAVAAVATWLLTLATGDPAQWLAVTGGAYAVFSWACALRDRDRPTFRLIWGTPAFLYVSLGYGLIAFVSYGVAAFGALYAETVLQQPKTEVGLFLGGGAAAGGFLGIVLGGRIADWMKQRHAWGRIPVIMAGTLLPVPFLVFGYTTSSATGFYIASFMMSGLASAALGPAGATTQDLVLPRMRGTATATFFIATALIGLALGPYFAGFMSKASGGNLRLGVLSLLVVGPVSLLLLILAWRTVPAAEATVRERARAAGEAI
ncbi:putative major facilitator superfamily transporter [Sphingomonas changbaiensis NBRC 104936]|uniref:Putative major facilitator superfamily transporter n=1 Tax=Sphingomonas changbaiensis NBRC 104936 TaxID=1219043 RepID=A0A0E9MKE3_9SPHN|nr:MFS transporter [Sphingomonas changbaiensis]GAO37973.1 putative major facilitator superfamily transporter [Sphingomonas changbaiensis NBRC 104936]